MRPSRLPVFSRPAAPPSLRPPASDALAAPSPRPPAPSRLLAPSRLVALAAAVSVTAAVLATGAAPASAAPSPTPPAPASAAEAERALRAAAARPPTLTRRADGRVRAVSGRPGAPLRRPAGLPAAASGATVGTAFLRRYGAAFGLRDARRDVRPAQETRVVGGQRVVRFQQLSGGVPVVGGDLVLTLDGSGNVLSAGGETSVAPAVGQTSATTGTPAPAAARVAVTATAKREGVPAALLRAAAPTRWAYDPAVLGAPGLPGLRPVWRVEVTGRHGVRTLVLVDVATGRVALYVDRTPEAKNRVVCDYANGYPDTLDGFPDCRSGVGPVVGTESSPPAAGTEARRAYDNSGQTYDFYAARFGRDSVDGRGMQIRSSVRVCLEGDSCPMDNAFWDGTQMVYGAGYANADDVVGHELTHGVTEHSSNLYYAYQSGAINESMSDVFGELIDLENDTATDRDGPEYRWKLGEDAPGGAIRDLEEPATAASGNQPDRMPTPGNPGGYYTGEADYGGVHHNSGVGNKAAFLVVDGGTFNGQTITGIGVDKAAHVYYRTLLTLSSGADYGDLGAALPAACRQLASAGPLPDGSGGTVTITEPDCVQVDRAVLATQLTVAGAGGAPDAPVCSSGVRSDIVTEGMEDPGSGRWAFDPAEDSWGYAYPGNRDLSRNVDYAHSGRGTLAGFTAEDSDEPGPRPGTRYATLTAPVHVPSGRSTYLRFSHAYEMELDTRTSPAKAYDGARVEYRVDGGAWTDALSGGTNGTGILAGGAGYGLALQTTTDPSARRAFTGTSRGYVSTRLDLSTLAGKRVEVRLAVVGDGTYGSYWLVDDVAAYSCGSAALPSAPVRLAAAGGDGTATVTWTAPTSGPVVTSYEVSSATSAAVPGLPATVPAGPAPQLTLTGLSTTSTYRVKVVPVSAAGRGAAAETAVGPAAVALTAAPPVLDAPGTVTVTARLSRHEGTDVPRGGTVTLQQQPVGGSWTDVRTATLPATDTVAFSTTASGTTSYRLVVPGQPGWFPTTSAPVQVAVRPVVDAAWSPSTITFGQTATISGRTSPARPGAPVTLTRLVGMTWTVVATGTTRSDGTYALAYRPPSGGTSRYRVRVQGNAQYADGYSGDRYLRVLPAAVRVTTAWSPSTVVLGQTSKVYGSTSPARPYASVVVQRYTGGYWRTMIVGRTSREGAYVLAFRAPARGAYLCRVLVVGDGVSYANGYSPPRYLSVR